MTPSSFALAGKKRLRKMGEGGILNKKGDRGETSQPFSCEKRLGRERRADRAGREKKNLELTGRKAVEIFRQAW